MDIYTVHEVTDLDKSVEDILARHHALMHATSPEESCHVMTGEELRASGARLFGIADQTGKVLGIGAIKPLTGHRVELKSMHTLPEARGMGLATILLERLLAEARLMGAKLVLLETGSSQEFAPARRLYERAGFTDCPPFEGYVDDPLSRFFQKPL